MKSKLIKRFFNIPLVWNVFQKFVGATQWKLSLYPTAFKSKGKLLDFACSSGTSTSAFLDFDYYGIDNDCEAIADASRRFSQYPNVKFMCTDVLKESFAEGDFDHALIGCGGHHFDDKNFTFVLDFLMSKLKKGGELHFFDPLSQPDKDGFITKFFIKNDQGRYIRTLEENKRFFANYSIKEIKIFPSPDRFIKLEDMLYIKVVK